MAMTWRELLVIPDGGVNGGMKKREEKRAMANKMVYVQYILCDPLCASQKNSVKVERSSNIYKDLIRTLFPLSGQKNGPMPTAYSGTI